MTVHYISDPIALPAFQMEGAVQFMPSRIREAALRGAQQCLRSADTATRLQAQVALQTLSGDVRDDPDRDAPGIGRFVRGDYIQQGLRLAVSQAVKSGALTGDSGGTESEKRFKQDLEIAASNLWDLHVGNEVGMSADATRHLQRSGDAAQFAFSRIVDDGSVVVDRFAPQDLVDAVPVRQLPAGLDQYRIRYQNIAGQVAAHQEGNREYTRVEALQPNETRHGVEFYAISVAGEDWLGRLRTALGGHDPMADKQTRAIDLLRQKQVSLLKSGSGSLLGLSGMKALRLRESTVILGSGVTGDDIVQMYKQQLRKVRELSQGSYQVNRVLIDQRTLDYATDYFNFTAGGTDVLTGLLMRMFANERVTMQLTHNLRDFAGTDSSGNALDGVFYYYDGPFGMKRRSLIEPGPVETFVERGVTITVYGFGTGDVHTEYSGSTLAVEQPVNAS